MWKAVERSEDKVTMKKETVRAGDRYTGET